MDKIIGKYLEQTGSDFPLDCETLNYIQDNISLTEILGNIAGDKAFLYGCEYSGSSYSAGYVFLRTSSYPTGEVLYWAGGPSPSGRIYIDEQNITVSANGTTYNPAYKKRVLSGIPTSYDSTGFALSEFTYVTYGKPIYGEIKIFSGPIAKIPTGYMLCDGSELDINEYPNLYDVIGTMYNTQHKGNTYNYTSADNYTTASGKFRIPDMSSRFIWGCNSTGKTTGSDIDTGGYNLGSQGGLSSYKLSASQSGMPQHNHTTSTSCGNSGGHDHWYAADDEAQNWQLTSYGMSGYIEKGIGPGGSGAGGVQKTSSNGTHYHTVTVTVNNVSSSNATTAHENKPPFIVMAYIIRVK